MVEILEKVAGNCGSIVPGSSEHNKADYSTFAEMYLEEVVTTKSEVTPTICTWRGIPTIDDW